MEKMIAEMSAAWSAGYNASKAALAPGNIFKGAFGVADDLGMNRQSAEWNAAVNGAMFAIEEYGEVWVNDAGEMVAE